MGRKLPWFRLYAEAVDDEKLRLLAFEDRWHFVALLCCKCQGIFDNGDSQDRVLRKLAVKLGVQLRELDEIHRRLAEEGLVDDCMAPSNWDSRQFKSDTDNTAAERQRRYRDKSKRVSNALHNGDLTRPDTDTDTDTEADNKKVRVGDGKKSNPQYLFDLWYSVYPNKKAKNEARKAWDALKPNRALTAEMVRAVRLQRRWRDATRRHDASAFIPHWKHPAPWLRSGSWEDELEWPKNQRAERKKSDLALTEFE